MSEPTAEESVDLTPGDVWSDAQIVVVRDLAAKLHRVRAEVDGWGDASREWYYEHRHDADGTTYACGFEDGWAHAEERIRSILDHAGQEPKT